MIRLSGFQAEIVQGLHAGARIVGPAVEMRWTSTGHHQRLRQWAWRDGRGVDANSIAGLIARGVVEIRAAADAKREVVLTRKAVEHEGE